MANTQAQRLLIPDAMNNVLMEFDGMDGSLVNTLFSDLEAVTFTAIRQPTEPVIFMRLCLQCVRIAL